MKTWLRIADAIDHCNDKIAELASWLVLACTLISGLTATLRYLFSWGSNALLEVQWFLFGLVFLFCAAWTLRIGGHVRIDILFCRLSPQAKVWVDLLGILLFLLPVCLLITVDAWEYALIALRTNEASPNPGGLLWWPMKFAIPVAFFLLTVQGISELIKNIAILSGHRPFPVFKSEH